MMVSVVILAAGKGKRMRSKIPKMLHPLLGKPLLAYGIEAAVLLNPEEVTVVASPMVSEVVSGWTFGRPFSVAIQDPPLGTADAIRHGLPELSSSAGNVLIVPGDVPLIRADTLKTLVEQFEASHSVLTILGAEVADPFGYGRIVTASSGEVLRIVEESDATEEEKAIGFINSGIMIIDKETLAKTIQTVEADNAQKEFYLTDLAAIFRSKGLKVTAVRCEDPDEILGVNDRRQLGEVQRKLLQRIVAEWQVRGVTFVAPEDVYLEAGVKIGQDTVLEPGVFLRGQTEIGEDCRVGVGTVIEDSIIGDGVFIKPYSVIERSSIHDKATIGPFAHLRPESEIGNGAKVGNFVEVKKSKLAPGVKASHLTYLGDSTIGEGSNIGAGTITCNYDGIKKHPTTIGKDVFVGSNTALVAPVTVGDGAVIAAGSVITKKVPPNSLGVSRARQQNIYRWKKTKRDT